MTFGLLPAIIAVTYAILVATLLVVRPWSATLAIDTAFLATYLTLCARYGLDAINGTGRCHPVVATLLRVVPAGLLIGAFSLAKPWLPGVLLVITLAPAAVIISYWKRARRSTVSLARKIEGFRTLLAPVVLFALTYVFSLGPAGGMVTVLICWLDFSYGYVGSGVEGLVPAAAAIAVVTFGVAWRVAKRDPVESLVLALGPVYLIGGYLLVFVYYNLPLDHTEADVISQSHTTMLALKVPRGPGRTLIVDENEQRLYLAVKSTNMSDGGAKEKSGVLAYDIAAQKEGPFMPLAAPCITMVVDEANDVLYSCEFFSRKIHQLDLDTLKPTGVGLELDMPMRPEGLVALDDGMLLARMEIPAGGPDLLLVDSRSMAFTPIRLPSSPLIVGCYALSVDRERKKIFVPQLGPDVIVLNRLGWDGSFEDSVRVPGLSFEAIYSVQHDSIFIATLNRSVLYRIDPETLAVTEAKVPNGIRSVREIPGGLLAIGDYVRGKIYLYDPATQQIVRTLLVGRKPQAITVSQSGKLYAQSSFGISVFDLPALLENPAPQGSDVRSPSNPGRPSGAPAAL